MAKAAARQGKLFEADAGKVEGKVETAKKAPAPAPSPAPPPVPAEPAPAPVAGPRPVPAPSRRVSAETLAKGQREISVSEFFVKNRHLLGFDNPSKALLTTIKEAVDNSLDACEEAGTPPRAAHRGARPRAGGGEAERRRADEGRRPLPRGGAGQRARHREGPGAEDLRQAPLRLEVPPLQAGAGPAGDRHLRGRHVRPAHHGQADPGDEPRGQAQGRPRLRHPARHAQERAGGHPRRGAFGVAPGARDAGRARDRRQLAAGSALRQPLRRAHRAREPARDHPLHAAGGRGPAARDGQARQRDDELPARDDRAAQGSARDQAAPARRRAGRADAHGARVEEPRRARLPADAPSAASRLRPRPTSSPRCRGARSPCGRASWARTGRWRKSCTRPSRPRSS